MKKLIKSLEKNVYFTLLCICNRMRPSRIKDKFSRVFSKFSQNCPSRAATCLDCEQSLFCSKIPAGGAAKKRVRYSSRSSLTLPPTLLAARSSPLEYRPRGIAVHPARILEQKRDCLQSTTRAICENFENTSEIYP